MPNLRPAQTHLVPAMLALQTNLGNRPRSIPAGPRHTRSTPSPGPRRSGPTPAPRATPRLPAATRPTRPGNPGPGSRPDRPDPGRFPDRIARLPRCCPDWPFAVRRWSRPDRPGCVADLAFPPRLHRHRILVLNPTPCLTLPVPTSPATDRPGCVADLAFPPRLHRHRILVLNPTPCLTLPVPTS